MGTDEWTGRLSPKPDGLWLFGERVAHRDAWYPRGFSCVWTRADGLEVEIEAEVDVEEGPHPVAVSIRQKDGLTSADYRVPVVSMTRMAAAQYTIKASRTEEGSIEIGGPGNEVVGPVEMGASRTDRARLERVAAAFLRAEREGIGVTTYVVEEEGIAETTAYGLIGRARYEGLLPESKPGRKAKP